MRPTGKCPLFGNCNLERTKNRLTFPTILKIDIGNRESIKVIRMDVQYNSTLAALERLRSESIAAGGDKRLEAQHLRGKLSARERIDLLLDDGTFEEFDMLKTGRGGALGDKRAYPGDGVITGHGNIDGREVFVFSQDFTVVGGSLGEAHSQKICKAMDLAVRVGAPIIGLNDSGGARIQEGVDALAAYGEIFHRNVRASGVVPQISCIMGPCAGGAVYSPSITDFVFMVRESSYMFVTGPSVVKTVTHQEISSEDLGGAQIHARKSGVAHFTVPNDVLCLREIRRLISYLPSNNRQRTPILDLRDPPNRIDRALDYLVPENPNQSYDMGVLIFSILDGGRVHGGPARFRPQYHLRLRPPRGPDRGTGGQPASRSGRGSRYRRLFQGGPFRSLLRRFPTYR